MTNNSCKKLEKDTVGHSESKLWVFSVARKINASNAHKVFIRKKKFETLVPSFLPSYPQKTSYWLMNLFIKGRWFQENAERNYILKNRSEISAKISSELERMLKCCIYCLNILLLTSTAHWRLPLERCF